MARFFRDNPKNGHNIPVVSGRCLWNCQGTLVTGYCLFQLRLQSLYIWQSFIEFFLIWAAAAQLEYGISCRMYDLCGDFQQFKTDSVDTLFFHIGGQWKSPEPVEKVVGKRMHLKAVCIHHHRMGTDRSKVKSILPFLDKVLQNTKLLFAASLIAFNAGCRTLGFSLLTSFFFYLLFLSFHNAFLQFQRSNCLLNLTELTSQTSPECIFFFIFPFCSASMSHGDIIFEFLEKWYPLLFSGAVLNRSGGFSFPAKNCQEKAGSNYFF